jgi:hypothetical protein
MTQDGGNAEQFQGDREGFEALPRNVMECDYFQGKGHSVDDFCTTQCPFGEEPRKIRGRG